MKETNNRKNLGLLKETRQKKNHRQSEDIEMTVNDDTIYFFLIL